MSWQGHDVICNKNMGKITKFGLPLGLAESHALYIVFQVVHDIICACLSHESVLIHLLHHVTQNPVSHPLPITPPWQPNPHSHTLFEMFPIPGGFTYRKKAGFRAMHTEARLLDINL